MSDMKRLNRLLTEKEKKEQEPANLDDKVLSKIVKRMKKKYQSEGIKVIDYDSKDGGKTQLVETPKIMQGTTRELMYHRSKGISFAAKFYGALGSPGEALNRSLQKAVGDGLEKNLMASGMMYSLEQYLSIVLSITILSWLGLVSLLSIAVFGLNANPYYLVLGSFLLPLLSFGMAFLIPSSRATAIARDIDKMLPFALRHMSIEIRAGVGIYNTMESIAMANYGNLSKGFKFVLSNIQKGVPAEEALESWAYTTKSESLQTVIGHLVRAIRTGGNLSDVMVTISEDISFERRMKIGDFAEKLNLMSLFLMMAAIVIPVMLGILTAIGSTPSIAAYVSMFRAFNPNFLKLIYFIISPAMILMFIYFIKVADPGA